MRRSEENAFLVQSLMQIPDHPVRKVVLEILNTAILSDSFTTNVCFNFLVAIASNLFIE